MPDASGFHLHYSVYGEGTPADPAYVAFTFTDPTPIGKLREKLPDGVTVEEDPRAAGRYFVKGRPETTRAELSVIFTRAISANAWKGKHHPV